MTEREKVNLLPMICNGDEHEWTDLSAHGCGALADDHVVSEAIVLGTRTKGGPGAVCNKCFQVWGQPQGVRQPDLVTVYLERMSWE
jgi:hypothetical protein